MDNKTRVRRTSDQIRADKISQKQAKIKEYEDKISVLRKEIEELKTPPLTIKDIADTIAERGLDLNDVMKALNKMAK